MINLHDVQNFLRIILSEVTVNSMGKITITNPKPAAKKTISIVSSRENKKSQKSPAPKRPSMVGKTIMFKLGDQPVVAVVAAEKGSNYDVRLCLPNASGVLVAAKEAGTTISRDLATPLDAVALLDRDAKSFQTRDPLENCKAAVEVKDGDLTVDYKNVTFEGYGSTFASTTPEDRDGDYIEAGAFDASLKSFRENPVMLTDHVREVGNLMGHYSEVSVNDRGLALKGVVTNSPHPDAVHTRYQIMEGSLKTLSIGGGFFYKEDYKGIEEIDLYETSLVVVPANPDAKFQVRALDEQFVEKAFEMHCKRFGGELRLKNSA